MSKVISSEFRNYVIETSKDGTIVSPCDSWETSDAFGADSIYTFGNDEEIFEYASIKLGYDVCAKYDVHYIGDVDNTLPEEVVEQIHFGIYKLLDKELNEWVEENYQEDVWGI